MLWSLFVGLLCSVLFFPFLFPCHFLFPLSIVQVPRITSIWPRTPFRPLFSTIQTASLLSSHPFEAAMFGVAGAMYYLCERAFTSRWNSSKVGLFPLDLGITSFSLTAIPPLFHSARINSLDGHFASDHWFQSCRMHRTHQISIERNITLKGQQTQNAALGQRQMKFASLSNQVMQL